MRALRPTGVTKDNMMSIAIAKHLGKIKALSYAAEDYRHSKWIYHMVYKILQCVPNVCGENCKSNYINRPNQNKETGQGCNCAEFSDSNNEPEIRDNTSFDQTNQPFD